MASIPNSITTFYIQSSTVLIPVNVGDASTLQGQVTTISGSGSTASVTAKLTSGDTVVVKAIDCYAPQGTSGVAVGQGGKQFDVGSTVTIPISVSSIVGTSTNVCLITCKTFSGTSVNVTGTSQPIQGGHQTVRTNYTLTQTDINNGYALISVTFPTSFADLLFSVTASVVNLNPDNVDPSNYYMGDLRDVTVAGCKIKVFLYTPSYGTVGSQFVLNCVALHD